MVKMLLQLTKSPQEDAADALAAALCHAHTHRTLIKLSRGSLPKNSKVTV